MKLVSPDFFRIRLSLLAGSAMIWMTTSAAASLPTSSLYDEQAQQPNAVNFTMAYSSNTSWTTGIGQTLGASQIIDLASFTAAIKAAAVEGRAGVIDFDGVEAANYAEIQSFTATFAGGAKSITFTNRDGHGGNYAISPPRTDRTAISGDQFLSTGGNPHFDFQIDEFTGFDPGEKVTTIGVTILGRNGQGTGQNLRVIAFYTNGILNGSSSTFRTFNLQSGNGTQDSFSGIAVPEGFWIDRLRVHSDSGVYTSIDDLAFITSIVEEVKMPPVITADLEPLYQPVEGASLTLSVEVSWNATPPLAYQWYRDGVPIPESQGGEDASYTFTAGPNTDGIYRVEISNAEGMDSSLTATVAHVARPFLLIRDDIQTRGTAKDIEIRMEGRSELFITGSGTPVSNTRIHLDSPDAWLFFNQIRPSAVAAQFLPSVRVNGAPAVSNGNVRVVQFATGTVVIPHAPDYTPLQVFAGEQFTGPSKQIGLYDYSGEPEMGVIGRGVQSFRLKRGYMATLARNRDGTGGSRVYIAQNGDLEISILPSSLKDQVGFIRVFPWRWVNKKGWAGGGSDAWSVRSFWNYDWGSSGNSSLDVEFVPMRHNRWWAAYPNQKTNVTHMLGFNEPDRPDQADMTVAQAIAQWPELMQSGLRLGSPAPADSGLGWLYEFMDQADARGYRVDFVAVHYYRGGSTANQLFNWLRDIHLRTGRPLWVTEWNNGANWTCCAPATWEENARITNEFAKRMDEASFVERYAVYNWVQPRRELILNGSLTAAGERYRDNQSTWAYRQQIPRGNSADAHYLFYHNALDSSRNRNDGMIVGVPRFAPGVRGQALVLSGNEDHVHLPPNLGNSNNFTFAGWINWDGGANWQRIFDFGADTNRFMALTPRTSSNTLRFTIRNGSAVRELNAPAMIPGRWTHVAVTISGGTHRLYVDGVEVASSNTGSTITPASLSAFRNYLGRSQFGNDPRLAGKLDDVRLLGRAMSAAEIANLARADVPGFVASELTPKQASVFSPFLDSIAPEAITPENGTASFRKVGGPSWLTVAPDGTLSGVPALRDIGSNLFWVGIQNPAGNLTVAQLSVEVEPMPGLQAFYGFRGDTHSAVAKAHAEPVGSPGYTQFRREPALDLNGTTQYLRLPADIASSPALTIATWVQWRGGDNWQRIFDFGNGTGEYIYLTPAAGNNLNAMRLGIRYAGQDQFLTASAALPIGTWVHLTAILHEGTAWLFLNGDPVAQGPLTLHPGLFRPATNYLGKSQTANDPLFNGSFRDFAIFNRPLSNEELQQLAASRPLALNENPPLLPVAHPDRDYSASLAGLLDDAGGGDSVTFIKVGGPRWIQVTPGGVLYGRPGIGQAGANRLQVRATDSQLGGVDAEVVVFVATDETLVALYEFEGNTDDSVGPNHGTPTQPLSYAPGLFGQAVSLTPPGASINLPASAFNFARSTLALRLRWEGGNDWQRILEFANSPEDALFLSPAINDRLRFSMQTSRIGFQLETAALRPGDWYHLAVTLDETSAALYVNGVPVASAPTGARTTNFTTEFNQLGGSLTPNRNFHGTLDDFRLYQRALAPSEIRELALGPFMATTAILPGYETWAAGYGFEPGQEAPSADPDGDGLPNLLEYLFEGDPFVPDSASRPKLRIQSGSELGPEADPEKSYLTLQARVRPDRTGISLTPQGATSIDGLGLPGADALGRQAGPPIPDGVFEIITFYHVEALEDSQGGRGFLQLKVTME